METEEIDEEIVDDQFMVSDFIDMKNTLAAKQSENLEELGALSKDTKGKGTSKGMKAASRADMRARTVQGNIYAQLALAFMNRSDHYHHADLFDVKVHQSWMPGYQGVSDENRVEVE